MFRAFADDVIGLAPPLCITQDEVDLLIDRLAKTLHAVLETKELNQ